MIVHPLCWLIIGRPIEVRDIEKAILHVLAKIGCPNLSFSGGLDSSLMLYFMATVFEKVRAFTIGFPETHPDVEYSRVVAKIFKNVKHEVFIPSVGKIASEEEKRPGPDVGVRLLYKFLAERGVPRIIACDGLDEFMAGYYAHQEHPDESTYYDFLRRLQEDHLKPLDENSGQIQVYLPYLDETVLNLLTQIPLAEKVDAENRKKCMVQMAKGKVPDEVVERWKYGFCDALKIKEDRGNFPHREVIHLASNS